MLYSIEVGREQGWPITADEVAQARGRIHDQITLAAMDDPKCAVTGSPAVPLIEVPVHNLPAPVDEEGEVTMTTAYFEALQQDLIHSGFNHGADVFAKVVRDQATASQREDEATTATTLRSVAGRIVRHKKKRDGE